MGKTGRKNVYNVSIFSRKWCIQGHNNKIYCPETDRDMNYVALTQEMFQKVGFYDQ